MTTFNSNRWNKVVEDSNQWTEVVSKKKHQQQHQQFYTEGGDPFAGMKASVDYEQEIERLKQLVPKKKQHYIPNNIMKQNHPHTIYHNPTLTISRSNSPDTTHSSSDSDTSSLSDLVTEQEKLRFFAFVHHWTGEKSTTNLEEFYTSTTSLWADQSPWNKTYWQSPPIHNKKSPIKGMGY